MQKELNCLVVTEKDGGFNVFYTSISEGKNDTHSPRNIIHKVEYYGHDLLMSSLREKSFYKEIEAAVKNNAVNTWEEFWVKWDDKVEIFECLKKELKDLNTMTATSIKDAITQKGYSHPELIPTIKDMIRDRPQWNELSEKTKAKILNF